MNIWALTIDQGAGIRSTQLCVDYDAVTETIARYLSSHWEEHNLDEISTLEDMNLGDAITLFTGRTGISFYYREQRVIGTELGNGAPPAPAGPEEIQLTPAMCEVIAAALSAFPYEDAGLILRNYDGSPEEEVIDSGAATIHHLVSKFES